MAPSEPKTPGNIAGIVLAAGAAERMGEAKQLMPFHGMPLVQHVVDAATASQLDEVVVVTGAFADEVEAALHSGRAPTVRNPDFLRGNMSSLACGAAEVPATEAIVLLMGDQPDIRIGVIDEMISLWRQDRPWGAVTAYRDRVAHPFLLSRSAYDEAVAIGGPRLLWRLLVEDETDRVVHLTVDGSAPTDVNTPDDYAGLTTDD